MLSLFKSDPIKKLRKQYHLMLEKAMQAQRKGDIHSYSMITADADEIFQKIKQLEATKSDK